MRGKRKKTGRQSHSNARHAKGSAAAPASLSPEEVVGVIVESIAPALFEEPRADEDDLLSVHSDVAPGSPIRGEEHRAHPRVALSVAIGLESDSHFFSGLSGDISEGGVFVQTYRDLPVGSGVEVHFELPEGELTAHGRVRWHRENSDSAPPGIGIAFESLAEGDRGIIERFCEYRTPLYYDVDHP